MFKKHFAFIRQNFLVTLQYRSETFLWIILDIIPFVALAYVWQSIFQAGGNKNGYTLAMVLQYYLLVIVIQRLSECHFENWRSEEIRNGAIDFFLIRPYSYIQQILTDELGGKLISIILFLPALVIFSIFIFRLDIGVASFAPSLLDIVQFLILLTAAFIINFCFSLIIVCLTFWFEGSSGLEHFKWAIISLFSGGIMPVDLMPQKFQSVINHLPFKYLYIVPIKVLQGAYQITLSDWLTLGVYVGVLLAITSTLWRKGRRVYASAGG